MGYEQFLLHQANEVADVYVIIVCYCGCFVRKNEVKMRFFPNSSGYLSYFIGIPIIFYGDSYPNLPG